MVKRKKFTATKKVKGRIYQYFRKDGQYICLPDDPDSEEYDRAYWSLMRGEGLRVKTTWDALILSYRKSARWTGSAKTKTEYERYFEYMSQRAGSLDVCKFRRHHAIAIQQASLDKPRTSNYIIQTITVLLEHAIDLGWRSDNPAKGVKKLKTGEGHMPWPEWAIVSFREAAPADTKLLFELALGTGQRAGDLVKMKWSDFDGEGIYVTQSKTKTKLWVPCTPELLEILDQAPRNGIFIVANKRGNPLTVSGAQQRMRRTSQRVGTDAYTLHGLRYTAASTLAELGATNAQIAAITGHKARDMVAKYSGGASQKRLAQQVVKLRKNRT